MTDTKNRGNEDNKINEEIGTEFNNFNFQIKKEELNFIKVLDDIRHILLLVLEKELTNVDRDLNMINQQIHSVKQSMVDLVQEIKMDIGENALSHENQITIADIFNMQLQLKHKIDAMSEMGEMESLRLQMWMDRHSEFMATLSNIMKKISTTQDSLVQNLK